MKKIIGTALVMIMLLGNNVFAAERTLTDAAKGIVKISGTTQNDGWVSVLITNPGYTYETASEDEARQYMQSFKADANGVYEHNIVLNMDKASSGYFKVYVKEGDSAVIELKELYFASVNQKYAELSKVLGNTELIYTDSTVKNVFGLNEQLYSTVNMSNVAKKLKNYLTENPIQVSDNDTNEVKLEKFGVLSNAIKEIAVIEAYNEGKSEILFNATNDFAYDDILKFTTMDQDNNVTVYALYKESLNDMGRQNVRNAMLKNNVESVSDIQRIFAKSVMFNGITNHKDQGYGHISNYITLGNVVFATKVSDNKTVVDTYLSLTDKSNADYYIKDNASSFTNNNFLEKIEYYAVNYANTVPGVNTGGNSSGGSKGSQSGISVRIPAADVSANNENKTDNKDNKNQNSASGTFKDVYDDFWGKTAIEYLYKKGIINGTSEDTFNPNDNLTREQAVKILCAAFDITDIKDLYYENGITYDRTDYTMFDDVNQYDWYGEYVFAAYRNDIVRGVSDRVFGVGQNVTRQDIAVMIYRAVKDSADEINLIFSDAGDIANYAKEAVSYMKSNEIIKGYEDNTFRPNSFVTRAEIAQIIYNFLSREG